MRIPFWSAFFYNADTFFALLSSFRLCWGAGGFGSGKTLLAVLLAAELAGRRLVERVCSNIDVKGKAAVEEYVPAGGKYYSKNLRRWFEAGERFPLEDTAIILDEAHLFLDSWSVAKDYVAGLRKANLYMLMPSIWPPHVRLRVIEVRRTLNMYAFGIPAWRYSWALSNGTVAEKGNFIVWRPHRVFQVYNTADFPADDGGIVDAIRYTLKLDEVKSGKANGRTRQAGQDAGAAVGGDFGALEDAVNALPDAIAYGSGYRTGNGRGRRR